MIIRFPSEAHLLQHLRYDDERVVFTNGCFDLYHPGHHQLVATCHQRALDMDGVVVVGVNSDRSVASLKGPGRPIMPEDHRAMIVQEFCDHVVIFDHETPEALIEALNPELVVKGGDYRPEDVVSAGRPVEIVPLLEGWSTTRVLESYKGGR
jgi:D-beta-D-heptose 7-phosphate kinase/D-beta-D-heptose 1-phosphate adenosyltransferase